MPNFTVLFLLLAFTASASTNPFPSKKENPAALAAMDTVPPVISCPSSVTLTLGPSGCDTVYTYTVSATDNLPGVIVAKVSGISSGQKFPAGSTTNLYIAVDAAGNTATCSFTVHVASNPPASVYCKSNVVHTLGTNCTVTVSPLDLLDPPFGCLDGYVAEVDVTLPFGNGPWLPALFGPTDLGKTYQFKVTNKVNGNHCWGDIKLVDSLPPTPQCPTVNVPCAVPSEHLTPAFLKDSLGIPNGMPAALDNCPGTSTLTFIDLTVNLSCGPVTDSITGYISRTWVARDPSGNSSSCVQTINRIRSIKNVQFPVNATVYCDALITTPAVTGGPFVQVGGRKYSLLTAPFCEINAFYEDAVAAACGGSWKIQRTWEVTDACLPNGAGNPVIAAQIIVVKDTAAPRVVCPSNVIFLQRADSTCTVSLNLSDLRVSDNCSPVAEATAFWTAKGKFKILPGAVQVVPGTGPGDSDTLAVFGAAAGFPVGVTDMLYAFTDACGNVASCEFQIEVWDSLPPVAVCDSLVSVFVGADGQGVLNADAADNGSSDSCSILSFKIRRTFPDGCTQSVGNWSDELVVCCEEVGDTVAARLRVYDVRVPKGEVQEAFAIGQFSECAVRIVVRDTLGPACTAPKDLVANCFQFDASMDAYGIFSYSCVSDSTFEMADLTLFDTACRTGTIARHFSVFDTQSGKSSMCTQVIVVNGIPQQQFFVRFPNDIIANGCDTTTGMFNSGAPQMYGEGCENFVATYTDELVTVVPDACLRIDRTWTVINTCTYNPNLPLVTIPNPNPSVITNHTTNLPGPVVSAPYAAPPWVPTTVAISPGQTPTNFSTFWSATANGYTYKQIIKLIDTQKPVMPNCPSGTQAVSDASDNDPEFWNASFWYDPSSGSHDLCEGAVDLCITATDLCADSSVGIRYLLFLDLDKNGTQETVVTSTGLFQSNTVMFGNAQNPSYSGGTPRQFDFRAVPSIQKYGFAIQTSTSGRNRTACVRWKTSTSPASFATPQLPYGTHRIRWFVTDDCGNESTCEYTFTVENASGFCGSALVPISGSVYTETGAGISGVNLLLSRSLPSTPDWSGGAITNINGLYTLDIPSGGTYSVRPSHDVGPLNGVSTLDMLLINKHILGVEVVASPYKLVAADVNKSKSVTTFDIVELRKLILGIYQAFPSNTSWRFVDVDYVFPQTGNPLQTAFPETQTGQNHLPANPPVHDFIGIKIGDVSGNALTSATESINEPRSDVLVALELPDRDVKSGDIFDLPFALSEPVAGFQFTLSLSGLEVIEVLPGPEMSAENFAVFPQEEMMSVSWTGEGRPVFTLRLRARTPGHLSDRVCLSARIARPEAYSSVSSSYLVHDLGLRFGAGSVHRLGAELYQNYPNPFGSATEISFYLPEETTATLRVFGADGREYFARSARFPAGAHAMTLEKEVLGGVTGVLYYTLETAWERLTQKMIVLGQ
ncbi:MAG: HYR domain-containing protein [Saprospiraceae bacterium]